MYYRPFLPDGATVAKPLYDLTKTGRTKKKKDKTKVDWKDEHQQAFEQLIEMLCTQPLLAHPRFDLRNEEGLTVYWLSCDASLEGCGVVFYQIYEDKQEHVIAYASKTMTSPERNYSVTDRELLAIVFGFKKFEHYLLGSFTNVVTDHSAAVAMLDYKKHLNNLKGRSARWAVLLQTFSFKVHYRKGSKHGNADLLSRPPVIQEGQPMEVPLLEGTETELANMDIFVVDHDYAIDEPKVGPDEGIKIALERLRSSQQEDDYCQAITKFLLHDELPKERRKARWIEDAAHRHVLEDGVLYRTSKRSDKSRYPPRYQVVVPESMTQEVLKSLHGPILAGHFGATKVLATAERHYFWPKMCQQIHDFVQQCPYCQVFLHRGSRKELLHPIRAERPNHMWGMDHVGPLPKTVSGNTVILVFIDYFTKWAEAVPAPDTKAVTTAAKFMEHVVCRHGIPEILLSDQGKGFVAELNQELSKLLGINRKFSTPYHPQTNGLVENFNKTLTRLIRNYVSKSHRDWEERVPYVLFAYRTAAHRSTGSTPFFLQHGFDARTPTTLVLDNPMTSRISFESNETIVNRLREAYSLAHKELDKVQSRQKTAYDQGVRVNHLRIGDLVLRVNDYWTKGQCKKFNPRYRGPYVIVGIDYPNAELKEVHSGRKRTLVVHLQRIKKFHGQPKLMESLKQGHPPELNRCGWCKVRYIPSSGDSWIGCDGCQQWFHFHCQDLKHEPENLLWYCKKCSRDTREVESD